MSDVAVPAGRHWTHVGVWIVRGLLALVFLGAGGVKLFGLPMMLEEFHHIGLGQWFRYLTGSLEIIGAILLLLPRKAGLGALLLICIMIGAMITHLFVIGGSPVPAIVLLALNALVAYSEREEIASLAKAF
ncbi:DoxX family protein [Bradyrhizobium australiense]|uniref:DoxX family protein n=1 Tax=Bradyrhizobium australiense TaxID=2721161 RepID=A0A7Y4GQX3_9BRAD|nr:DoxX family protein [Bradyrhizobium australiense]NOJ40084.1 DoxX family protein [Bradyrhizobium australiense]